MIKSKADKDKCKHDTDIGTKRIRIDNENCIYETAFFRVVYCKKCGYIEPKKLELA